MLFILGCGALFALLVWFFFKIIFLTFLPWVIDHWGYIVLSFFALVFLFIVVGLIRMGNAQRRKRQ